MSQTLVQTLLPLALFSLMLGLGLSLRYTDFRRVLQQPQLLVLGLVGQLLLLPLLVFALVQLWNLPPALGLGLVILALAPGGATSNLITHLCRGDTALSVSLTACSSLIVPFSLPLLTAWLLASDYAGASNLAFPVLATLLKLVLMALLPVLLGMALRQRWPQRAQSLRLPVKLLSVLFLVWVVVAISLANWGRLSSYLAELAPVVLTIVLLAMGLGYLLARLKGEGVAVQRTLAIEIGIQNAGTALLVTGGVLQDAQMSAAALLYGILMQLPALLLIVWCNRPGQLTPIPSVAK